MGGTASKDIGTFIYDDLRSKILSLKLEPGSPISENELCELYSASRTPVRTALHRLADQKMIDLFPYQQSRVSLIDVDAVREFIYARVAIEDCVIRDFLALGNNLLLEDVSHLIRKQEIVLGEENFSPEDFYFLDVAMHEIWFRATNKLSLWALFNSSVDYTRIRILDIKEEKDYQTIIDDHVELLSYIREQKVDEIHPVVRRHIYGGLVRIEERMNDKIKNYFK